jgi:hypothetical protein
MNTRATVILVVIFLVLLGAVYITEGRKPPPPPREGPQPLMTFNKADVSRLQIKYQGASATFERAGDTWKVLERQGQLPPPTPTPTLPPGVNITPTPETPDVPGKVSLVLDRLLELRSERVLLPELSADPSYGLDSPSFEASVLAGRQELSIAVGKLNPSGFSYYVRRNDKKDVVLASRSSVDSLTRAAAALLRDAAAS